MFPVSVPQLQSTAVIINFLRRHLVDLQENPYGLTRCAYRMAQTSTPNA